MTFSLDYRTICQTLLKMHYTGTVKAAISSGTFAGGTVFLQFQEWPARLACNNAASD